MGDSVSNLEATAIEAGVGGAVDTVLKSVGLIWESLPSLAAWRIRAVVLLVFTDASASALPCPGKDRRGCTLAACFLVEDRN